MPDRLRISLNRKTALTVNRVSLDHEKLAYVMCGNRKWRYAGGRSPIVYIGTTKKGLSRIASSVVVRAWDMLYEHGFTSLDVRVVTCQPRRGVKTWLKLERALLLAFRDRYGEVPCCNTQGSGIVEANEFELFSRKRINTIIADLGDHGAAASNVPLQDSITSESGQDGR